MKANQLRTASVLSYIQIAMGIIIGIIYTPIMIRLLGKNEYGLYTTVAAAINMLSILNLGLGSGYIRYHAKYKAENDNEKINKLNGLFLTIFSIIAVIVFSIGMYLSFHLEMVFSTGLTQEEYKTAQILMILLTINITISFPMSVISNIIVANERYIFLKVLGMVKTVLTPLLTLPLLLLGFKSIGMVVLTLILNLIVDIIQLYYVLHILKNRFILGRVEKSLFTGIFTYTIFVALNLIVDQLNWNIDKIIIARFKGTESVAIYSVGYSLYVHYMTFSTAISGLFTPRVHMIVNNTIGDSQLQKTNLTELFVKVGRIQFLILALICSGFLFFGKQFLDFWVGTGYENAYYIALLLMLPSLIPFCQNVGIEVQRAKNIHQFRAIVYIIMAVINLISSIYLCQLYGEIGSAIGTAVSLVLANGIVMNIYYHQKCNIDIISFWKSIGSLSLGLIIPIIVGGLIVYFFDLTSVLGLIIAIIFYIIIYCASQWFIGMNEYEKSIIFGVFKKLFLGGKDDSNKG